MTRTSGDDAAAAVVGKDARALHTEQKRDTRPGVRSLVVRSGVRPHEAGEQGGDYPEGECCHRSRVSMQWDL